MPLGIKECYTREGPGLIQGPLLHAAIQSLSTIEGKLLHSTCPLLPHLYVSPLWIRIDEEIVVLDIDADDGPAPSFLQFLERVVAELSVDVLLVLELIRFLIELIDVCLDVDDVGDFGDIVL